MPHECLTAGSRTAPRTRSLAAECIGFVTGKSGNFLRQMEEEWGTLMFFAEYRGR